MLPPRLIRRAVTVIAVRAYMVVGGVGEFLHCSVQLLLRPEVIQVGAFVLQGVDVSFHRCIVVWVSCLTHALGHMDRFAKLYEILRCILASLVTVQDQALFCRALCLQCLLQGADCQVTGDVPVCYTGDHTAVIEVYDGAVITDLPVFQEQICEIRTPLLIWFVRMEVLLQLVFEYFMRLPRFCSRFFRTDDGMQAHFGVHIFMDGCGAVAVSLASQVDRHAAITVNTVVPVVNLIDLLLDLCFFCVIIPPSGVSGSYSRRSGRSPAASAASGCQILYDVDR